MENNTLNKNWIKWFIGFCDADANFQVFPKKREKGFYNVGYGFHLSLSIVDINLLNQIQNTLKIGQIYEYPVKNEARLAITKLKDLNWLIENVFDVYPLVTNHQRIRYFRFREGILNKINRIDTFENYKALLNKQVNLKNLDVSFLILDNVLDSWISGFINGEGYFYLRTIKENKFRKEFFIEHTDPYALEIIKNRLEITSNIISRAKRSVERQETYVLHVSSIKNINNIIKLCDTYGLKGNKLIQYEKWKNEEKG